MCLGELNISKEIFLFVTNTFLCRFGKNSLIDPPFSYQNLLYVGSHVQSPVEFIMGVGVTVRTLFWSPPTRRRRRLFGGLCTGTFSVTIPSLNPFTLRGRPRQDLVSQETRLSGSIRHLLVTKTFVSQERIWFLIRRIHVLHLSCQPGSYQKK